MGPKDIKNKPNLRKNHDKQFNWVGAAAYLTAASPGPETDEFIDELAKVAFINAPPEAIPALIHSLDVAENPFTIRSVALALSQISTETKVIGVVDALDKSFNRFRQDAFLGPELLQALSLLAVRHPAARPDTLSILFRLTSDDPPHLLIKAAKIIGRFENISETPGLRGKLDEIGKAEDPAVLSEGRYQKALLEFSGVFLGGDFSSLREQLINARVAFARTEISEERRSDATIFIVLLDLFLEFFNLEKKRQTAIQRITELLNDLLELLNDPCSRYWYDYQSPSQELLMIRLLHISDAFKKMAKAINEAEEWTNFDDALVDLAAVYHLSTEENKISSEEFSSNKLARSLAYAAPTVALPRLGPALMKAISRKRFDKVIERYESTYGIDEISAALRLLEEASLRHGYKGEDIVSFEKLGPLLTIAEKSGEPLEDFIYGFTTSIDKGEIEKWGDAHGLINDSLPIDNPSFFGNDPLIDETVRELLDSIRKELGVDYPKKKWNRLIEVVVSIVQIIQAVREDMPEYTKCEEDGGLGQKAKEPDFQKDFFCRLRMKYGRSAEYEITPISGGRCDTGLKFPDCEFPIEVKREFKNIKFEHIHDKFIGQADDYATSRDRVSFLIILDLRKSNSGRNLQRKRKNRKLDVQRPLIKAVKLYSLYESFWVDGLPIDTQIHQGKINAVIVCLLPGNRTKPSSTTTYSKR